MLHAGWKYRIICHQTNQTAALTVKQASKKNTQKDNKTN